MFPYRDTADGEPGRWEGGSAEHPGGLSWVLTTLERYMISMV